MRKQTLVSSVVLVFVLSAIASAGILGVLSAVQTQTQFEEEIESAVPAAPAVDEALTAADDSLLDDSILEDPLADDSGTPGDAVPAPLPGSTGAFDDDDFDGIPVRLSRVSGGRLENAQRAELQLINNAQVLGVEPVGQGGVVQWANINEGVYSLLARGADGFATGRTALQANGLIPEFGLIPWVDMPVVEPVLERDVYAGATRASLGAPVEQEGWENILYGANFVVDANGTVSGRVSKTEAIGALPLAVVGSRVLFIRDGRLVGDGITDENGEFQVSGLAPGVHTFLAASNLGLLGIATEIESAAAAPGIVGNTKVEIRFVAGGTGAGADPTPPGDIQAGGGTGGGGAGGGGPVPGAPGAGGGGMGGGTGGGTGGGGGVGGGGDGLMSALLGGALGAAAGFIAGDDGNDKNVASP
jgi:hypothetical protein